MVTKTTSVAARVAGRDREMMPADKRDEALERLARASGQVAGMGRMIDDGRHCTDALQQHDSAKSSTHQNLH